MHQNMSLRSLGVDWVLSLRIIPTRLRGTNFCTSSERFARSSIRQLNNPKCTQMVRNTRKHEFRVQWGGSGAFVCETFQCDFVVQTFALVRYVLFRDWQGKQMVPNAPKWYKTNQNMSLGSNGVDRVRSMRNDSTRLRRKKFCTSSERFAPSFVRQLNSPKCTQMV